MIHAALFDDQNQPVKIMDATIKQLTANIPIGGYWREIPEHVTLTRDVPDPATLPVYPIRVVNVLVPSEPLIPEEVHTNDFGQVTFSAPTGLKVLTTDDVEHTESGGDLVVQFPSSGRQYIKLEELGKAPVSYYVNVVFLGGYADKLKGQVDQERDLRLVADLTFDSITLDGDEIAQKNITEAATMGALETIRGNLSWSINWITAGNTIVSLTAAQLEGFAGVISARRSAEYAAARAAKDSIMAAVNQDAADAALASYLGS